LVNAIKGKERATPTTDSNTNLTHTPINSNTNSNVKGEQEQEKKEEDENRRTAIRALVSMVEIYMSDLWYGFFFPSLLPSFLPFSFLRGFISSYIPFFAFHLVANSNHTNPYQFQSNPYRTVPAALRSVATNKPIPIPIHLVPGTRAQLDCYESYGLGLSWLSSAERMSARLAWT
jgi:hypothetical protein